VWSQPFTTDEVKRRLKLTHLTFVDFLEALVRARVRARARARARVRVRVRARVRARVRVRVMVSETKP